MQNEAGESMVTFVVWVDTQSGIASFHEENGYEKKEFSQRDYFLEYITELVNSSFRFQ